MSEYLPEITTGLTLTHLVIIVTVIPWILSLKKESLSAMAWCLAVFSMPILGFFFFYIFGYNHVHRPLRRKRRHRAKYKERHPARVRDGMPHETAVPCPALEELAVKFGAYPTCWGNEVTLYNEGRQAFEEMLAIIESAKQHVHMEYFIFQPDEAGTRTLELLGRKAKEGVEVRLLYDAVGSHRLPRRLLKPFQQNGGRCSAFLSLSLWRRRWQLNMRNHRKIVVVDGRVGFTGGMNIGDEYLGKDPAFGYWRDEHIRLEGPAVGDLQGIFVEDWDFAHGESLSAPKYFPELPRVGNVPVQVIASGPDQEINSIREMTFAAILAARKRLWIASPYLVPDGGILDALRLAAQSGVDVRIMMPLRPDHWLTYYAARYYMTDLLAAGVKIYHYSKGMMHSKFTIVDNVWAMVGSANLDNRSLHLNFESNCIVHAPTTIAELEKHYLQDLQLAVRVEKHAFGTRPYATKFVENACRLLSPVL